MVRWKLFGRAKKEDSNQNEEENTEISMESSDEEKEIVIQSLALNFRKQIN